MSLFSSIQMAGNALRANDVALQVVGQNISNASTPGYIREQVILSPSSTQSAGNLIMGTGVQVEAVVQMIDKYLNERLRTAMSNSAGYSTLNQTYTQLQQITNSLSGTDLGTTLDKFFSSVANVLNQPSSNSVRGEAVQNGLALTQYMNQMSKNVEGVKDDCNNQIRNMPDDINRLTSDIASLNAKIAQITAGATSKSDAVGLTDQRVSDLEALSQLIGISTSEQPDGTTAVYSGGEYLVFGSTSRSVEAVVDTSISDAVDLRITQTNTKIADSTGLYGGLVQSRDVATGGFLNDLNNLAQTLTFEFNKIYSSGQGLNGYSALTSENAVNDPDKALNAAGLFYQPQNGSFQIIVHSKTGDIAKATDITKTTNIYVQLNGSSNDTTLNDLKDAINNIDGISASITQDGKLTIQSDSSDVDFAFANDSSNTLAALGLNTFFKGTSAGNIGICSEVQANPDTFAASQGGINVDSKNAAALANFMATPLQSQNAQSLGDMYTNMIGSLSQTAATAQANTDSTKAFTDTLSSQQASVSGVNIDEETINMMMYQRAYQANAKYISTLSSLFDVLVNI